MKIFLIFNLKNLQRAPFFTSCATFNFLETVKESKNSFQLDSKVSKVSKTLSSSGFHISLKRGKKNDGKNLSRNSPPPEKSAITLLVSRNSSRSEFRVRKGIERVEEDDASSNTVIALRSPTSVWSAHAPAEPTCLCKNRISRRRVKRRPWTNRVLSPSKRRCPFSFATPRLP